MSRNAPKPAVDSGADLAGRFLTVRMLTEALAAPLSAEDQCVQSMPDASPVKWHLAHTSWFFETLVLARFMAGYRPYDERYGYLFNSYYEFLGDRHPRPQRGLITRPSCGDIMGYRRHVDLAMRRLLEGGWSTQIGWACEIGVQHEQQHQELILTDIKHALSCNPLLPAYVERHNRSEAGADQLSWREYAGGIDWIGSAPDNFAFDNEQPRHRVLLAPFRLASRLTNCGEYLRFMEDGGYDRPEFWLSDGWNFVQTQRIRAPLYWIERAGNWQLFTLNGIQPFRSGEPVVHVSFYEADAYARWCGKRLPTEFEWEAAAANDPVRGNLLDSAHLHPETAEWGKSQFYGDAWEWTRSGYEPYPGFKPWSGIASEYSGKFMCGQMVLRGGSCVTPVDHIRPGYRNFFPPPARWQFSGIRLCGGCMKTAPEDGFALARLAVNDGFRDDLMDGLSRTPKAIPCKYFYDADGARLFEKICALPEYYPTRVELSLLRVHAPEIAALAGPEVEIMEFGAGAGEKICILLDVLERPRAYIPMDISVAWLDRAARRLREAFPHLEIHPLACDFAGELRWPMSSRARRLGFFPGSTIGNFSPAEAREFLIRAAAVLRRGALLIGVDLVKDPAVLHTAYNDSAGVTAAFNLNLLQRANREAQGHFDLSRFSHYALYNPVRQRVEMYLVSSIQQEIAVGGRSFNFAQGEAVLTEYSYKYTIDGFRDLALSAGFNPRKVWCDAGQRFSLHWLDAI